MDWERVEPIYNTVLDVLRRSVTVGELPGVDELRPLIIKHSEDIGPSLMIAHWPLERMGLNQNAFYIGLAIGVLYAHHFGLPDWACSYLRGQDCLQHLEEKNEP